ncbi:MAG: hypothetical protein WCW16_05705 [Candidatus Magasanikbacteria bacterium]
MKLSIQIFNLIVKNLRWTVRICVRKFVPAYVPANGVVYSIADDDDLEDVDSDTDLKTDDEEGLEEDDYGDGRDA